MKAASGEDSREAILRAAAEIVTEHGYSGTTIARITAASGLPASSLYWYFEDKDDLLAAVVETSFREFSADLPPLRPLGADRPITTGMRQALVPHLRALMKGPVFAQLGLMMTMEERLLGTKPQVTYAQIRKDVMNALEDWFAANLQARRPDTPRTLPRDLARIVMAFADGLFIVSRADVEVDIERYVDTLMAVLQHAVESTTTSP